MAVLVTVAACSGSIAPGNEDREPTPTLASASPRPTTRPTPEPGGTPTQPPPTEGAAATAEVAVPPAFPSIGDEREDGAVQLAIPLEGSLQNPAWSPDDAAVVFTRFRRGYNREPADLYVFESGSGQLRELVADDSGNVNLPGSAWNAAVDRIVFSSSRDPHDEIYVIDAAGGPGDEIRLTTREGLVAYEPTLSPDGLSAVFETHVLDAEDNGVVMTYDLSTGEYTTLTEPDEDCRQPNWSPSGDLILYQKLELGDWDIWVTDPGGRQHRRVTHQPGDQTDASFSPDGRSIVYSSNEGALEFANLFILSLAAGDPMAVTRFDGYDGAPSWSSDGTRIAFESYGGDPDDSSGTAMWLTAVPAAFGPAQAAP